MGAEPTEGEEDQEQASQNLRGPEMQGRGHGPAFQGRLCLARPCFPGPCTRGPRPCISVPPPAL
eukprot:3954235-Alexandrium_andersonii.AAC.1